VPKYELSKDVRLTLKHLFIFQVETAFLARAHNRITCRVRQ